MSATISKHRIPTLIFWTSALLILIAAVAYEPYSAAGRQRRSIAAVKKLETELASKLQADSRFRNVEVTAMKDSTLLVRGYIADKLDAAALEACIREWKSKGRPAIDVQVGFGSGSGDDGVWLRLEREDAPKTRSLRGELVP